MKIGACGIACDPGCGLFFKNICQGCERSEAKNIPCAIIKCAVEKDVEYCGRDCAEFPCNTIQQGYPYSNAYIGMYIARSIK